MAESPENELVIQLTNLHATIQKQLSRALSAHGISVTEYLVLRQLRRAPDKRMRRVDLATEIGLSASGVTRLLNPMEKIGLVSKQAAARDARASLVALSDVGERVLREAEVSFEHAAKECLAPLNSKQFENLTRIVGLLT
ncbi:MAG: MarR family transcriptional regulator [Gammaproteobacteria bacterium]|jgi:DNA-binding MarR family transcriptional regulator